MCYGHASFQQQWLSNAARPFVPTSAICFLGWHEEVKAQRRHQSDAFQEVKVGEASYSGSVGWPMAINKMQRLGLVRNPHYWRGTPPYYQTGVD